MAKRRSDTEMSQILPTPMSEASKHALLQRLLDQAGQITVRSSDDPVFKAWKNTVERALVRVYGQPSPELQHFHELRFFYSPIMWMAGDDFTREHLQHFERDLQILLSSLKSYVEELPGGPTEEIVPVSVPIAAADSSLLPPRVFVSHALTDAPIVEELVELLEIIGLTHEQIFCTSLAGYDIDLGANFLDAIKAELLNSNTLVLFLLTRSFFRAQSAFVRWARHGCWRRGTSLSLFHL